MVSRRAIRRELRDSDIRGGDVYNWIEDTNPTHTKGSFVVDKFNGDTYLMKKPDARLAKKHLDALSRKQKTNKSKKPVTRKRKSCKK
jgi:hypothetical protein